MIRESGIVLEIFEKTKRGVIWWHGAERKILFKVGGCIEPLKPGDAVVFTLLSSARGLEAMHVSLDKRPPAPLWLVNFKTRDYARYDETGKITQSGGVRKRKQ